MAITHDRLNAARAAVAETGERFADLVAATDPEIMATADWSVADTAAHVLSIARMYTTLVRSGAPAFPALQTQVRTTTVDNVSELNARTLDLITDREPASLAGQLRADIDEILAAFEETDPATPVPWLGDSRVPVSGLLAHLVNELHIHGRDIARAGKTPWVIPPADAALFFEVFFVELVRCDVGQLLDNDEPPRDRRIAVEFRSRYTAPVTLVLHKGKVSVAEQGGNIDVRIFFDPPTFNLMLFHRVSKARAALTGKVITWGRRPWLLPAFLKTVRCP